MQRTYLVTETQDFSNRSSCTGCWADPAGRMLQGTQVQLSLTEGVRERERERVTHTERERSDRDLSHNAQLVHEVGAEAGGPRKGMEKGKSQGEDDDLCVGERNKKKKKIQK